MFERKVSASYALSVISVNRTGIAENSVRLSHILLRRELQREGKGKAPKAKGHNRRKKIEWKFQLWLGEKGSNWNFGIRRTQSNNKRQSAKKDAGLA